jgi:dTDP-4-amino-4,6-dideoxygalactose transaminase
MQKHLAEAKIATGIHYPVPLHLQKAYAGMGHRLGDFPVTEKVAREIVSLPMFPQLSAEQCERVVNEIANFLQNTVPAQGGLRPVQAQGS